MGQILAKVLEIQCREYCPCLPGVGSLGLSEEDRWLARNYATKKVASYSTISWILKNGLEREQYPRTMRTALLEEAQSERPRDEKSAAEMRL